MGFPCSHLPRGASLETGAARQDRKYTEEELKFKFMGKPSNRTKYVPQESLPETPKHWTALNYFVNLNIGLCEADLETSTVTFDYNQAVVSFVEMPVTAVVTETPGVISVTMSGKNLSNSFFEGTRSANVAVFAGSSFLEGREFCAIWGVMV